ncbi:helix-turn-helix domain-containing protein [Mesorhizobium sp. M0136]|uniref:helix-turn-helix domain-containing protein n=1 Tax=Mesorhizobium sp. M0136 TaxID=2956890 RepID=UPI00333CC916
MSDPVPAQATGSFQQRPASARLRGSFASVWVHRMDPSGSPPIVIMPDTTIDLQWIGGSFRIAGPDKEPQTEVLAADEVVIGLRFHPAAAAAWLGVPQIELVGKRLSLDDLWGARARRLASRVRASDSLEDLACSLQQVVAEEVHAPATDVPMQAAYRLIERGPPPDAPLVPWLMRALEMSERTLRRRFDTSFGYGPKTLDRILRYQRFLRLSSRSSSSTAMLAAEAGYSDQAHLVRESRRLTGSTPRQIHHLLHCQ